MLGRDSGVKNRAVWELEVPYWSESFVCHFHFQHGVICYPDREPYLVTKYTIATIFISALVLLQVRQVIVIKANIIPILRDFLVKNKRRLLHSKLYSSSKFKRMYFTYGLFPCISEIFELLCYYFWNSFWDPINLRTLLLGVCSKIES